MLNLVFSFLVGSSIQCGINQKLSRSLRWPSGNPRNATRVGLLELVREFESRRGDNLNLFTKIINDQLLRAPSLGKHNSTRVDEGRKR